jgi:peptidoglycan/LPS O-acetylase OafA/YrhL
MGKVVCAVFMAIGIVIFLASRLVLIYAMRISSADPLAFEHDAYAYLAGYVGTAFILLGLLFGAVIELWPSRIRKSPLPSHDDLPSRPPDKELRAEDDDRRDGR